MFPYFITIILIAIVIICTLFVFSINNISSDNIDSGIPLFQENKISDSKIKDLKNDTKLVTLYKTNLVPEIRDYHDILSTEVSKVDNNKLLFTIELDEDANDNKDYETVYIWLLFDVITSTISDNGNSIDDDFSMLNKQNQVYTLIIPNFGVDSKFGKDVGWYLAIFNNTDNSYTLPLSRISNMPTNKVQVFIDPIFIGNPLKFNYIVSSMIRVNNTFLDKPPDYLIDTVPDNYESFWKQWFK